MGLHLRNLAGVLAFAVLAVHAEQVLYCSAGRCLTEKLTPVDSKAPLVDKYDCFDLITRTSEAPSALDPLSPAFATEKQQLLSAGFNTTVCADLPSGSNCNRHGNFDLMKRICECESGWVGPECSQKSCPNNCNSHGFCSDGICYCFPGFKGAGCELTKCENDCHQHGKCENGICVCHSGYTGPTCAMKTCPNECSFHGECNDGICTCDTGFQGEDCSEKQCPNNCYASVRHGVCVNGVCACNPTWTGYSCETAQCPNQCSGHGVCDPNLGTCICQTGFTGYDCSQSTCESDCGQHGVCGGSKCVCDPGYSGPSCLPACPKNCSGEGVCQLRKGGYMCFCNKGRSGSACDETTCPNDCSGHGTCDSNTDLCVCNPGYMGLDCSLPTCHGGQSFAEGICSGNGYCQDDGVCQCADGWKGEKCSRRSCLNSCSNHGICTPELKCKCDAGWTGLDCSEKTCPNSCSHNGVCNVVGSEYSCVCDAGFGGFDCSIRLCKNNCSGHGDCIKGSCYCNSQYIGEDCSELPCGDCSGHGKCNPYNKVCTCDEGWTGTICQIKTCAGYPDAECSNHGVCLAGQCVCKSGYSGADCSEYCTSGRGFASNIPCSGHGKCSLGGKCLCDPGWVGPDCATRSCPQQCNGKGVCRNGTCECDPGFEGEECEDEANRGMDQCDCSMECTVKCLRHCSGIHDRYGMSSGHQCYMKCNHACIVGCVSRGVPSVEHFIPDASPEDYAQLFKTTDGSPVTPDVLKSAILSISQAPTQLIQQDAVRITQEYLPTMD